MEVDNDMLNYLSSGDVLQFKGEGEENVVLITKNQTYEVILTETSNSLLLVTDLLFKDQVENDQDKTINKVLSPSEKKKMFCSNAFLLGAS